MRVLIAPDGFGGTLSPRAAAAAIADGWRRVRPGDELELRPLSDGGEGLLDVVGAPGDDWCETEVAGPLGHPVMASYLLRPDGTAVIESARACGLSLVPAEQRTPMRATSYGVGQLVLDAHRRGARHILVGLGGSATVDGGAGALTALGHRLLVADGSGLKIGGEDLQRIHRIDPEWAPRRGSLHVTLLADVTTELGDAARLYGPQKGATPEQVTRLSAALDRWADVVERDLADGRPIRTAAGSGAAGGLAFGLSAALGCAIATGAARVAALVGLGAELERSDLVVTGEGRLDATSFEGKVVGTVRELAAARGVETTVVTGSASAAPADLVVETANEGNPGPDPAAEVADAAARLAARW